MMRRVLLLTAFAFCAVASVQLFADTRYALEAREPVGRVLQGRSAPGAMLALVLQEEDCGDSGEMIRGWWTSAPADLSMQILVVSGDDAASTVDLPQVALDLPIRVLHPRAAASLGAKLGYKATPFAVILDSRGRLAGTSPGTHILPPEVIEELVSGS